MHYNQKLLFSSDTNLKGFFNRIDFREKSGFQKILKELELNQDRNKDILTNSIYLNEHNRLNVQNTIKNAIIDNKFNNNSLIVLYNKNIHIIKIILQLFKNMIIFIKTEELKNIDKSLCSKVQSKSLNKNM